MFISSGLHAGHKSNYPTPHDDDMSSVSSSSCSIDLHDERAERTNAKPAPPTPPIQLPAPALPQVDALKPIPAETPVGPWQEAPIKRLTSLTDAQAVYKRAMAHSARHGRKVVQAALLNGASLGVLAQTEHATVGANKPLNVGALLLKQFFVDLAQKHPDRFQEELHNLFFSFPHPPRFDDCFQYDEACRFQGVLAGLVLAAFSKLQPETRGLDTERLRMATDAFGVHLNSILGRSRLFQRHMPVLWPAGRSLAKALYSAKSSTRENLFRFVATIEDFMIASNIHDARAFNGQMLKTLRHCMV